VSLNDAMLKAEAAKHPYPLLFATVSGAHLYGFASPDSDVDLRGVHILPAREALSLEVPPETVTHEDFVEGIEIDLVTHDAKKFFGLLLKRNGYVLEQVLSPLVVLSTPEFEELRAIAPFCATRHHVHHYRGFALNEWEMFKRADVKRIKPLLYVYRVLLTGVHLMRTGEVQANLPILADEYNMPFLHDLVREKTQGTEKGELAQADVELHTRNVEALTDRLLDEAERTPLPETTECRPALNDLLVRLRLKSV